MTVPPEALSPKGWKIVGLKGHPEITSPSSYLKLYLRFNPKSDCPVSGVFVFGVGRWYGQSFT